MPPPPEETVHDRVQGDYLFRVESTATSMDFDLGTVSTVARHFGVLALRETAGQLVGHERLCFIEFESDASEAAVVTEVFERVPQSTQPAERAYSVTDTSFSTGASAFHLGYREEGGALPSDPGDARSFDQDGDGAPGVAIYTRVEARGQTVECTFSVAWRIADAYQGTLAADALSAGIVTDHGGGRFALSAIHHGGPDRCDVDRFNDADPVVPSSNRVHFARIDPLPSLDCPDRSAFAAHWPR